MLLLSYRFEIQNATSCPFTEYVKRNCFATSDKRTEVLNENKGCGGFVDKANEGLYIPPDVLGIEGFGCVTDCLGATFNAVCFWEIACDEVFSDTFVPEVLNDACALMLDVTGDF